MEQSVIDNPAYKAAETYERFFVANIFRYWTPLFIERVRPGFGMRVLDVACGTGVVARSIVPIVGDEGEVVGLDLNPSMLEVACRQFSDNCGKIVWREGRAESMPFPDQVFDLVVCQQGLQFFQDRPAAAREMARVARVGGRIGIEVWQSLDSHPFYIEFFDAMTAIFDIPLGAASAAFIYGDPAALENLLLEAGLKQVRVEQVRHLAYFPDPDRFIEGTFNGASAVIPAYARIDGAERARILAELNQRVSKLIARHTNNGVLEIPFVANIATAVRE